MPFCSCFTQKPLWFKVLLGLVLGVATGFILSPDMALMTKENALHLTNWLAFPGYLFLAVIQMVVIPLILASVARGIADNENVAQVRRIGWRIVVYFLCTTAIAVSIGSFLANIFEPGIGLSEDLFQGINGATTAPTSEALTDTSNIPKRIVSLLPKNPFEAISAGEMLQIVLFAAVMGAALISIPAAKAKPVLAVLEGVQEACIKIVMWVMKLAPLAVFGLTAQVVAKSGFAALATMGIYMVTVLGGLACMLVVYALILHFTGKNPWVFFKNIREAQLIAFSTSSSAATMPVTLQVAENNLNIKPSVAKLVVPLGTTINMDGTALYQAVATIFLAQAFAVDLGFSEILLVLLTAIAASVGTPGTPGVGIVVLASILHTVGVPTHGIALIIGVDRILDMCRTTVNVTGDLVASSVMERLTSSATAQSANKKPR